jgi:hypothetical protein
MPERSVFFLLLLKTFVFFCVKFAETRLLASYFVEILSDLPQITGTKVMGGEISGLED